MMDGNLFAAQPEAKAEAASEVFSRNVGSRPKLEMPRDYEVLKMCAQGFCHV